MEMTSELLVKAITHLWPRKVLIDGMLLPEEHSDNPDFVSEWMKSCEGDVTRVEEVLNHVHAVDLMIGMDDYHERSFEDLKTIAKAYSAFLEAEIRRVAPGREYVIEIHEGNPDIPVIELGTGKSVRAVENADLEIWCRLKR